MIQPLVDHPGHLFIREHGPFRNEDDIVSYADFLRTMAGLTDQPPIDLTQIHQRFGIPAPLLAPLQDQQGLLFDSETGIMLIKEDDPITRQRFTNAHELMEMVCEAHKVLPNRPQLPSWLEGKVKERLCDRGAATLLMPLSSFSPLVRHTGVSLAACSHLAKKYGTSFMATLSRMTQYGPGAHIVVVWRYAHKPSQHCLLPSDVQPSLFGSQVEIGPPKKLRVWWSKRSNLLTDSFVPYHKSVNEESLIQAVFDAGGDQTGVEYVEIGAIQGECVIEARRVTVGTELCVVSLLHLPQDDNCQGRNKSYGHSVL